MNNQTFADGMSSEEWTARCELAALYRLLAHLRMTDLIFTHISVRLPGPGHRFLINNYGRLFHMMRASDLIAINSEGVPTDSFNLSSEKKVNAAGFTIHSAIHMARHDVSCVIHTHTSAGIAVSALKDGLLPLSQHALKFYSHMAYHEYEGVALDLDERERLVGDLGTKLAMILRNHGLLTCGRSIAEAFHQMYYLERACQAQVAALQCGRELVFPPKEVCERTAYQFNRDESSMLRSAQLLWESSMPLLGDPSQWCC